jgi:hypothetical protein
VCTLTRSFVDAKAVDTRTAMGVGRSGPTVRHRVLLPTTSTWTSGGPNPLAPPASLCVAGMAPRDIVHASRLLSPTGDDFYTLTVSITILDPALQNLTVPLLWQRHGGSGSRSALCLERCIPPVGVSIVDAPPLRHVLCAPLATVLTRATDDCAVLDVDFQLPHSWTVHTEGDVKAFVVASVSEGALVAMRTAEVWLQ